MSDLVLVTVPIGNIEDITLRALKQLREGKKILCEDTRTTRALFKALEVDMKDKHLISFHDHSSQGKLNSLVENLKSGQSYTIVSEAGSPIISDPAFALIKEIRKIENVKVSNIPGVSSVICALELSNFSPIPFHFHGFLPRDKNKISSSFNKDLSNKGTHIYFESPERILSTLTLLKSFVDIEICVAREMTKKFETVYNFKPEDIDQALEEIECRGEMVLLVEVKKEVSNNLSDKLLNYAQEYIEGKRSTKHLVKILSEITNKPSKELYKKLL